VKKKLEKILASMLKLRKVKERGSGRGYAAFFTPASKNANHSPESA
jgi:hypothetical protein